MDELNLREFAKLTDLLRSSLDSGSLQNNLGEFIFLEKGYFSEEQAVPTGLQDVAIYQAHGVARTQTDYDRIVAVIQDEIKYDQNRYNDRILEARRFGNKSGSGMAPQQERFFYASLSSLEQSILMKLTRLPTPRTPSFRAKVGEPTSRIAMLELYLGPKIFPVIGPKVLDTLIHVSEIRLPGQDPMILNYDKNIDPKNLKF